MFVITHFVVFVTQELPLLHSQLLHRAMCHMTILINVKLFLHFFFLFCC